MVLPQVDCSRLKHQFRFLKSLANLPFPSHAKLRYLTSPLLLSSSPPLLSSNISFHASSDASRGVEFSVHHQRPTPNSRHKIGQWDLHIYSSTQSSTLSELQRLYSRLPQVLVFAKSTRACRHAHDPPLPVVVYFRSVMTSTS
ncbi:hypothetical protein TcWFU_006315 [Taenia crassiceps]|uniref:Uncharacterized protein n=1 Tax=Taenia crassiceps TaxID=6207 RepID=A0ABR4QLV1_9CEST